VGVRRFLPFETIMVGQANGGNRPIHVIHQTPVNVRLIL